MNEPETIKSAVASVASHPAIASAFAATSSASGALAILSQTQTVLGVVSLAIGCVVGLLVIRCNYLRSKLLQREWDNGGTPPKDDES